MMTPVLNPVFDIWGREKFMFRFKRWEKWTTFDPINKILVSTPEIVFGINLQISRAPFRSLNDLHTGSSFLDVYILVNFH